MRAFIAIEIPEENKNEMSEVQRRLKGSGVDASWTREEGMHLTLKFLGEVSETKVVEIMNALTNAVRSPAGFRINVAGIGAFPDQKNARVVWAGIAGDVEKLAILQAAIEEAMAGLGFEREKRTFTPHLTLGRIKHIHARDRWLKSLDGIKDLELPSFEVHAVSLMKSELKPAGAVYTEMGILKLT
jgi:2'-5' RNA ligase